MGRFFCLLLPTAAMLQLPAWIDMVAQSNGPAMTQVIETVYHADRTAAMGTVLILWPAFTTADGKTVAAGSMSVKLDAAGAFAASPAPNTGAQPAGVYYRVVYQLAGQEPSTEYWVVPATGSTQHWSRAGEANASDHDRQSDGQRSDPVQQFAGSGDAAEPGRCSG